MSAVLVWGLFRSLSERPTAGKSRPVENETTTAEVARQHAERGPVFLYFTGSDRSYLTGEERVIDISDDPAVFARNIVKALIMGPRGELTRTVPAGTSINALYVTQDGTAFIDLSREVTGEHPGGMLTEMMTVYSIVNSIVLNVPQIDTVKFLINGREASTLAGHISLHSPFKADMLIIR